jgi:hypothetical protein
MLCMHSPGGYINREQIMNLPCQLDENDKRKKNHVRKVKSFFSDYTGQDYHPVTLFNQSICVYINKI